MALLGPRQSSSGQMLTQNSLGRRPSTTRAEPPGAAVPPAERLPTVHTARRDPGVRHDARRVLRTRSGGTTRLHTRMIRSRDNTAESLGELGF